MTFCVNDDDKIVVVMPAIKKSCILALYIMNSIFSFIARENFHKCTYLTIHSNVNFEPSEHQIFVFMSLVHHATICFVFFHVVQQGIASSLPE